MEMDTQSYIALAAGIITFLVIEIPFVIKRRRVKRIIENGKKNNTFIVAKRIGHAKRYYRYDKRGNESYFTADYEYMLNGKVHRFHFNSDGFGAAPTELALYYDNDDKSKVYPPNAGYNLDSIWQIPVLAGIIVGVVTLWLLTR